ncbi:FAD-binding oxidoreductase [Xanthomonadaceae bacterium JHOS43]|nr:FAD-binding oxidoreductase [Xanthomonadaceae bacterium JHOS43]
MANRLPLRLLDRRLLAPGVLHVSFEHRDGVPLPFKPGQFIQLFFTDTDGQEQRRSYSIANPPPRDQPPMQWDVAVGLMPGGVASGMLQTLPLGSTLDAGGPFGRFHLMQGDAPRRFLLVATGTGVAPFHAMRLELERHCRNGTDVVLLCGARTRDELLYRDTFVAMAREIPEFSYRGCLTREAPPADQPELVSGRVQDTLASLVPGRDDLALLCGNPAMVDDCATWLSQAGLPLRSIRRERYIASG